MVILKAWHPSGSKSSRNNSPHWTQFQGNAAFSGKACPKVILSLCACLTHGFCPCPFSVKIMVTCFKGERSECSFSEPLLTFPQPVVMFMGSVDVQGAGFERAASVCVEVFYCSICKELIDKVPVGGAEEYILWIPGFIGAVRA